MFRLITQSYVAFFPFNFTLIEQVISAAMDMTCFLAVFVSLIGQGTV